MNYNSTTKKYISMLAWLLVAPLCMAQQTISYQDKYINTGLEGSIDVGMFFANKNTANFYNGNNTGEGMNSADRIINNTYHLNDINATLEQNGYRYPLIKGYYKTSYPEQMSYNMSMSAGIGLRYWFKPEWAVSMHAGFARVESSDLFLIHNTNPNMPPSNKENQYVKGYVSSEDTRVHLDLGVESKHPLSENIMLLVGTGFSLNNTTVQRNDIQIYNLSLDIRYHGPHDYVPNGTQQQYNFRQGGIGYGLYLSPGLEFIFLGNVSVDVMAHAYYSKVNLQNYDHWGFQWMPYLRFNLSRLLF